MKNLKYLSWRLMVAVILTGFAPRDIKAQDKATPVPVYAVAKASEDSVVLRWAPSDWNAWNMARFKGYQIKRYDVVSEDKIYETVLTKAPVKPWTREQIRKQYGESNKYISLLDMAMYSNVDSLIKRPDNSFVEQLRDVKSSTGMLFLYSMQAADFSPEAATVAGLRWVDKDVRPGGRYIYVITSDTANAQFRVDTAMVTVINIKPSKEPSPEGLRAINRDKQIELQWNRQQAGNFSTYNIERSDDGGKTWDKLNNLPFYSPYSPPENTGENEKVDSIGLAIASILKYNQVYIDSIPVNYKEYQYRINGNTAFAETSPYSKPVKAHGIDLTAPEVPRIKAYQHLGGKKIMISWDANKTDTDLAGYYVSRGPTVTGPFEPLTDNLLSKTATSFTDTSALVDKENYYVLMAVDTAHNLATSMPLMTVMKDSIPPSAPAGLAGTVDSLGIVSLHWDANPEQDVKGYKVYYSYNRDGEYSQVTGYPVMDNQYRDTIPTHTMDRRVFYKVVAVDYHNNHSGYSAPAVLTKPVYIPPTSPLAESIVVVGEAIQTDWIGSSSQGVAGYEVFRKEKDGEWKPLAKMQPDANNKFRFMDTTVVPNKAYFYAAETIDSSGLRSEKSPVVQLVYSKNNVLPAPENVTAVYDKKETAVKLTWVVPDMKNDYFLIVYRAKGNEPLAMLQSVDKEQKEFLDYSARKGAEYRYAVQVKQVGGNLNSGMSKEAKIGVQ
ncbi:MAG: hypothetical protein J5I50_01280 [Chitinophagaceae bacterium]|nr:hypothetical protein [Chitinophagaceae bacterium]